MTLQYILIALPMLLTYLMSVLFVTFGVFELWYGVSPVMHAIGGFVTAWTVWMIVRLHVPKRNLGKVPRWSRIGFTLGVVLAVGIAWEWYELILEMVTGVQHTPGVGDMLIDLTMDGVGALVYTSFFIDIDK